MRTRLPLYALVAAHAVSMAGNVLAMVAIPWFVLETTGSGGEDRRRGVLHDPAARAWGAPRRHRRSGRPQGRERRDLPVSASAIAAVPLLYGLGALEFWLLAALVFVTALFDAASRRARLSSRSSLSGAGNRSSERRRSG